MIHSRKPVGGNESRVPASNRYELLTCGLRGHVEVGRDVAYISDGDQLLAIERDGFRWYRCLRCDAWTPALPPEGPSLDRMPDLEAIELPLRGSALRDRYVLRLIALDRAVHVFLLTTAATVLLLFARHHQAVQNFYNTIISDLNGGGQANAVARSFFGHLDRAVHYQPRHLMILALVCLAYAALEATEMVGLWFARRWAEYLTFVATTILVPYEIYELTITVSALKVTAFVLNLAIVAYLLWSKRLFGLRGGEQALAKRRDDLGGWGALKHATPWLVDEGVVEMGE